MSATDTVWLDQLFMFPGGTFSIAEGDAARTELSSNIAQCYNVIYTGALTANRTITFPLPTTDALSYNRTVWNNTTGSHSLVISVGGALTTVTVAAGATARLIFEPAGVRSF
jgi:hypothetical protein